VRRGAVAVSQEIDKPIFDIGVSIRREREGSLAKYPGTTYCGSLREAESAVVLGSELAIVALFPREIINLL
jgi:hypothetical protein